MRIPGIFIGNAVGNSRCSRWRPPFRSDIFAGGDGTIITIGTNKYFKDLISGKHLPITNYDFDSTWLKGFPYKSVATISAPVGDLDWISHDPNNFWYAIDGTPNQIPVVSCFQDVDYEHVTFFKHAAQVVDEDGIETYEPRVLEWAVYKSVRTGVVLTTCQTYFDVPVEEISTVKWVTKTGLDAQAGTKAAPWLKLQKGNDSATEGDIVYSKSGIYTESDSLTNTLIGEIKGIGLNEVRGDGTNFTMSTNTHGVVKITGMIFNGEGNKAISVVSNYRTLHEIVKCVIKNAQTTLFHVTSASGQSVYKNLIFIDNKVVVLENDASFDTCMMQSFFNIGATCDALTLLNSKIIYNKAAATYYAGTVDRPLIIKGCTIHVVTAAYFINDTVAVSTNNLTFQGNKITVDDVTNFIQLTDSFAEINILSNKATSTKGRCFVCINTLKPTISNNIITSFEYEPIAIYNLAKAVASDVVVSNNHLITKMDTGYHIEIGLESTDATANDTMTSILISNNYMLGNKYFAPANDVTTHGIFVGFQGVACSIKYNFGEYSGAGIVLKGNNSDYSANVVSYNIMRHNQAEAIVMTGIIGAKIYNNTFIENGEREIYLLKQTGSAPPESCEFKNNIIVNTSGYLVEIKTSDCTTGHVFDYNKYYSTAAKPFKVDVNTYTFAEWQALGYDAHSTFLTAEQFANLFTDYANGDYSLKLGSAAIGAGEDLGLAYNDGLSPLTNWGNTSTVPNIVKRQQDDDWDCGAYVNFFFDEPIIPDNALLNDDDEPIRNDDGTYILTN